MKYIIETPKDMYKLAMMYAHGEVTAEEYFEAVDQYSKTAIQRELKQKSVRWWEWWKVW